MNSDLSNYRISYHKSALSLNETPDNPLVLFKNWFEDVDAHFKDTETNAMTLATIGLDGFPKSRIVLLKRFSDAGFVFFTNYTSDKGKAITKNPQVSLSFFWQGAERQVIIKGQAEKLAANLSDAYFKSRPRGSQLGAIVSNQSTIIENRDVLESELQQLEKKYEGKDIPRPDFWGGYLVKPLEIEFWQGRPNRLHDRIRYQLDSADNWIKNRLSP